MKTENKKTVNNERETERTRYKMRKIRGNNLKLSKFRAQRILERDWVNRLRKDDRYKIEEQNITQGRSEAIYQRSVASYQSPEPKG